MRNRLGDSPTNRLVLAWMGPLGAMQDRFLAESDYTKVSLWLHAHPPQGNGPPPPAPATIDWDRLIRETDDFYNRQPAATTYCTGPLTDWDRGRLGNYRSEHRTPDENFQRVVGLSKEWTDLDLLLRTARDLNIRLLVICQPFNTTYHALQGLTPGSTAFFFDRVRAAVAPYTATVTLLTFPQAETDPHWYVDSTHPSAKAWLMYDRAMDAFYHAAGDRASTNGDVGGE